MKRQAGPPIHQRSPKSDEPQSDLGEVSAKYPKDEGRRGLSALSPHSNRKETHEWNHDTTLLRARSTHCSQFYLLRPMKCVNMQTQAGKNNSARRNGKSRNSKPSKRSRKFLEPFRNSGALLAYSGPYNRNARAGNTRACLTGDYPQVAVRPQLDCGHRRQSNCRLNLWVITKRLTVAIVSPQIYNAV